MDLTSYLHQEESKTLEFKENCYSLNYIIKTVIAFANTAGGTLLIGISDNKEIVGIDEPLKDEQRLSSAFADSIKPLLIPDISIITYRQRSVIVICVYHSFAPFYLASEGKDKGVYIRLGSSNRQADSDTIDSIRRWKRNTAYDELPCPVLDSEAIDFRAASELFSERSKIIDNKALHALGIFTEQGKSLIPTIGGVLLFGSERKKSFPDAIIRCARFEGVTKTRFIDQLDIDENLPESVESALSGMSKLRNRVIGRVFKELNLIEQWGTGIIRIIEECAAANLRAPKFEEIGTSFRVTLYADKIIDLRLEKWEVQLIEYLKTKNAILTKEAAELWEVTDRAARSRLLKMIDKGQITEVKTSPTDPKKVYVLSERSPHV